MFPASFYQQLPVYRAPSPDHHRQAQPFTIAASDSYDLFCTPSPQAYATAEASALEHLHRQAALEALHARERELEKQRRLARLAALEEAQHREYHQQQIFDAYLQAQARARAQQEAERLQRERQRQYQERAAAIARAQAIQRERAERARAAEIERRREEARQRIFVRDLMDSLFADGRPQVAQPQQVPQQRFIQAQQTRPQVLQPPTGYRIAQPQVAQPRVVQPPQAPPQIPSRVAQPQPQVQARFPQPAQPAQPQRLAPQAARQPSPDSEQEAFERFLDSFFGVASPQISKPRGPAAESRPSAFTQAAPARAAPPQVAKPPVEASKPVTRPEPAKPKALEQPATQPQPAKVTSTDQADELTNLLSTVFGVPVNVKNIQLGNNAASPPIVKASTPAESKTPASATTAGPAHGTASPVARPASPTPEKQPASAEARSPSVSQPEDEELTEDFKQMVDKVFKDLERVFGVQPAEETASEKKEAGAKKEEAQSAQSATPVPETANKVEQTADKPEATPQSTRPSGIETPSEVVDLPAPVAATSPVEPAAPIPDTLEEPSEEQSTEISTEILDDDDVPSSAAELQDEKAASAATLIQQKYRKHHARVQRLEKLESLKAKLDKISKGFTFPEHLDFQDPDSEQPTPSLDPVDGASHDGDERVTPVPPLSFTHNNAPYHAHAQALLSLLVAADAISSDGDKDVRSVRKAFVKEVEEKLAEMERQRSAVYRKQQAEKESSTGGGGAAKADSTESHNDKDSTPTPTGHATPAGDEAPTANAPTSDNATPIKDTELPSSEPSQVTKPSEETQDSQPTTKDSSSEPTSQSIETDKPSDSASGVPVTAEAVVVTDPDVLTAPIVPETASESAPAKTNAPPRPSVEDEQESSKPSDQAQNDDFVIVEK